MKISPSVYTSAFTDDRGFAKHRAAQITRAHHLGPPEADRQTTSV